MSDKWESLDIVKGNKGFGMTHMPYRKKPCLYIREKNALTKVASFNNPESAELFMEFVADLFNVRRKDEE